MIRSVLRCTLNSGKTVMQQQLARDLAFRKTLCLYHYPCPDGIFAALALHKFHAAKGIQVNFVPNTVWSPVAAEALNLQGDEVVYLVDFAGPHGFAKQVARSAQRVVVLDHHKTSATELTNPSTLSIANLEVHFDMDRSGATVSLDYFEPEGLSTAQMQLFKYIEDADLWRWRLPDSKAFHAGLASLGLEFDTNKNPAIFYQLLGLTAESVIAAGKPVLEEQQRAIDAAVAAAFPVSLGGGQGAERGWGRCLAVAGGEDLGRLRSQIGNAVADKSRELGLRAMAVVAYSEAAMNEPSKLKCSLRSIGDEDSTVISEAYGGGGHKNASSFILEAAEFEAWRA